MESIKLGLYEHYKGLRYQVIGLSRHSETLEPIVVYQQLYGDYGMWVRPMAMFLETIELEGADVKRFKYLGETVSQLTKID